MLARWLFSVYLQSNGSQDQNGKDDDHAFTTVLCSARDHFTLKQDMCLSCGSYGVGEEGKLIACVQCGQCYHPYCVNIKVQTSTCVVFLLLLFQFALRVCCCIDFSVLTLFLGYQEGHLACENGAPGVAKGFLVDFSGICG